MKSWRTTLLGILTVLGAVTAVLKALVDGDPSTNPDWVTTWAAVTAGVGLIFAKDHNVTGS